MEDGTVSDVGQPTGLPLHWVNGSGFVMVSPALTKELDGDFIAAGVAGRIWFLSQDRRIVEVDEDGTEWVPSPAQDIADGMGISVKQVRSRLLILENRGFIKRASRSKDSWDRTHSVALVYRDHH